jgi:hypothetical protein
VQVVVYQDKEFPGSLAEEEGLLAELKTCGTCKVVSVEQFSASQVGTTLPADTVSFVRSHPDVTHLWAAFDPAAIVQAAGAAAGWAGRRREAPQHDRRDAEPRPDPQGRRPGRRRGLRQRVPRLRTPVLGRPDDERRAVEGRGRCSATSTGRDDRPRSRASSAGRKRHYGLAGRGAARCSGGLGAGRAITPPPNQLPLADLGRADGRVAASLTGRQVAEACEICWKRVAVGLGEPSTRL